MRTARVRTPRGEENEAGECLEGWVPPGRALRLGLALALLLPFAAGSDTRRPEVPSAWLKGELERHQEIVAEELEDYRRAQRPLHEVSHDWSPELRRARAGIDATEGAERREAVYAYLDLGFGAYGADLDSGMVHRALREIPPGSPLWSLEPYLLETVVLHLDSEVAAYIAQVVATHPDPEVRRVAASRVDPARPVASGKPVPKFSFQSLDEPSEVHSAASLRGVVYLIDFWATWCAPCVAEMSGLHAAADEFGGRGFQILSISLDDAETVAKFRRERWKMPWLHAVVATGLKDPLLEPFEVSGLPMPILVDRNGIIVAVGLPLRGPRLHRTLRAVFSGDS